MSAKALPPGVDPNSVWVQSQQWMKEHIEIPAIASLLYLLIVFGGQYFMSSRERLNVRTLAITWNGLLAVFSWLGVFQYVLADYLTVVQRHGLSYELCTQEPELLSPWVFFFAISKIPELFDTAIHVMKKQKVIFLHWYHHITVMWFCWVGWAHGLENGGTFSSMNFVVHSIMYTYYALGAYGFRFPNPLRLSITLLQILQMVFGTIAIVHNMLYCNFNPYLQLAGLLMYLSYFALFVQFFIANYCTKKPVAPTKKD